MEGYLEAFDAIAPRVVAGRAVRTRLCSACGAPAVMAPDAGSFVCGRCSASTILSPRPQLESVALAARGARAPRRIVKSEYDIARAPQGLKKLAFPAFRELSAIEKLVAAYLEAQASLGGDAAGSYRSAAGGGDRAEAERRLLWASRLVSSVLPSDRVLAARPLLEQAFELCRDPHNQALACCQLARIAQRVGDADAAREWLAGVPDQTEELAVDSARRECLLHFTAETHPDVLSIVGRTAGELPVAPAQELAFGLARVACYERLDEPSAALEALQSLLGAYELDIADAIRREPRHSPVRVALERDVDERRRKAKPQLWAYGMGFFIAVLIGLAASYWGRVVDVTCTRPGVGDPASCEIQESVWGWQVSSTTVRQVRDAIRRLYRGDKNKQTYVLALTTERGETIEVSPLGDSQENVDSQVARLNAVMHQDGVSQATVKITNDGPLLVGAVAFAAALAMPLFGAARFLAARRPRGAAARVLAALD